MRLYLDTSAFVPLLVAEPTTPACQQLWDAAETVWSARVLRVEAAAALAQAERLGRLLPHQHRAAVTLMETLLAQMSMIEVDDTLTREAATLAHSQALRGYDALHCAAARTLPGADLVVATGDRALATAWLSLGIPVANTHAPQQTDES